MCERGSTVDAIASKYLADRKEKNKAQGKQAMKQSGPLVNAEYDV